MKITWLGHSAAIVEGRKRILIDPFLDENPSATIKKDNVKADLILVTHGHGDHLGDAIYISKKLKIPIVAIYELAEYISSKGADAIGMNFSGTFNFDEIKITMVPALHSSGISEDNFQHSGGLPCGYIIKDEKTVYHAGDTGIFGDMELIGKLYSPDISMLPIGGFFTMGVDEAALAAKMLRTKYVIPIHYNTWEPIKANPEELKKKLSGISEVVILKPGESASF